MILGHSFLFLDIVCFNIQSFLVRLLVMVVAAAVVVVEEVIVEDDHLVEVTIHKKKRI